MFELDKSNRFDNDALAHLLTRLYTNTVITCIDSYSVEVQLPDPLSSRIMYNGEYERMWLLVKLGKLYILAHPKLHGDKVMKFADTEAGVRHFSADGIELEQ